MAFSIDSKERTWVPGADLSEFPIQNLPFGTHEDGGGIRIGHWLLDVAEIDEEGPLKESLEALVDAFGEPETEAMDAFETARREAFKLLQAGSRGQAKAEKWLVPVHELALTQPTMPFNYVDFYSGIHHAENVGRMFRPDQPPLLPNYRHLPIGYNGRASSIISTDAEIARPYGVQKVGDDVVYGPTQELDFELELGYIIGRSTELGDQLDTSDARQHIAGLVLVNDWSARDTQRFEYQPLGPFLAKSFATSVSPWLVSLDALESFRIEGMGQDPAPLPHLRSGSKEHYDLNLEVSLQTVNMTESQVICRSNAKYLYWSIFQQIAHLTSNGTNLEAGDLYATGTISGPEKGMFGSLLEATWRGTEPLTLAESGETRTFLEDGDTVTLRAWAERDGLKIGLGEVTGQIV
jgi:fumarylacetoacetase